MFLMALTLMAIDPPPRPMEVEVVRDAVSDRIRAFAILRDRGNRLVVSCNPARYEGARVSFHSRRWLARGNIFTEERPVVYRFDQERPRRRSWDVRYRRATLDDSSASLSFINKLRSADRLVFRARDIEDRQFDIVFRLNNVRPAIDRALEACAGR